MESKWQPAIPLRDLHPECVQAAQNLRTALGPTWVRLADRALSAAEVEKLGCADYLRVFGHPISPRNWRRKLKMVRLRGAKGDGSDPITLFVPERLRRRAESMPPAPGSAAEGEFPALSSAVAAIKDPTSPTIEEKAWLWHHVFKAFETEKANGGRETRIKRSFLQFLEVHAPGVSGTAEAMRKMWNRNFESWVAGGRTIESLKDGRAVPKASPPIPEADIAVIQRAAVFETGGRIAQAWRLVRNRGDLTTELEQRFQGHASRKSYVPNVVRQAVTPMLEALGSYHRGPRTGKLNGAYVERDWSGVNSGDWYQADDVTLPVYYYVPEGDWFRLTRGQALVMMDLRSRRVLDFVLIDEKAYDSIRICRLMNRVCDRFGLPRRGFYFEGGIWEKAKLVTGTRPADSPDVPEIASGLAALGIEFIHARSPRAKPVERVLGLIQDRMESEPGYVGRNEMVDRFERVQRAKLDVAATRRHPAEAGFLDADGWFRRLSSLVEEYNATPMESPATQGLSPDQAWERFQVVGDPPARLPPEIRSLLAPNRSVVSVGRNGITVAIGKRRFVYRSEETGLRRGQKVIACFDAEDPEFCTMTDLSGRNPVVVPLAPVAPAIAGRDRGAELGEALASAKAHEKPIRERYSNLRAGFIPEARKNLISPAVEARAAKLKADREVMRAENRRKEACSAELRCAIASDLSPDLASALSADISSDPDRTESALRLAKLLAKKTSL